MEIKVNGIKLHYQEYNDGPPIIFLHGNGESLEIFKDIKDLLPTNRVILIDSRNHGESTKKVAISYELMARDLIAFVKQKKLVKPIIVGFSDGAIISLLVSIKEPALIKKQVLMGSNINPKGLKVRWQLLIKLAYFLKRDPLQKMMLKEPQIRKVELSSIKIPTLVLAGSKDIIKRSHTLLIADSISGSHLKILNNETHMSYVLDNKKLIENIKGFINDEIN